MPKILVAEDERDIRELIRFTLSHHGHEVVVANNGDDALGLARREHPDLILLDVRMPRLDGVEVCRRLKADPALRAVPVAFLSAKGQDGDVQEGLAAGAVEYILKPFAPDQLARKVAELLAHAAGG